MRRVDLWCANGRSDLERFRCDHRMAAVVASARDRALACVWYHEAVGLSAGRFHRLPAETAGPTRRASGGRVIPVGPGILAWTFVVPGAGWLDPSLPALPADRILNRALRPLLEVVRACDVDAFYGGRDLVTVDGERPLAYAAFCHYPDGVVAIEAWIGVSRRFSELEPLARRLDPHAVVGTDLRAFASAVCLDDICARLGIETFVERLAAAIGRRLRVAVDVCSRPPDDVANATPASEEAYLATHAERGPYDAHARVVAEPAMLGVVEAAAVVRDGHLTRVQLAGDLIAPFHVVERIQLACEGAPLERETIARRVRAVLRQAGSYLFGCRNIDLLLARLADAPG